MGGNILLEYAEARKQRLWLRRLTVVLSALLVVVIVVLSLRKLGNLAYHRWAMQQCLGFKPTQNTLFCERVTFNWPTVLEVERLHASDPRPIVGNTEPSSVLLFLHALAMPSGGQMLVSVTASHLTGGMTLWTDTTDPSKASGTLDCAGRMSAANHEDLPVTIHYGRVDPMDPAHVIFDVDYGTATYKLDGRLRDDGSFQISPNFGWVDAGGNWQIEAAVTQNLMNAPTKAMDLGYPRRIDGVGSLLSKDGKLLIIRSQSANDTDQLDLWDVDTQKKINSWDTGGYFAWPRFSDDGKSITGFDNGARVFYRFAIPSGKLIVRINAKASFTQSTSAHSFFDDDRRLAVSSPDEGLVRVYDLDQLGKVIQIFKVPTNGQQNLAVSADGKYMAFWQFEPKTPVRFYEMKTGRQISQQYTNPQLEEFGFTSDDKDFIEITDDGLALVDVGSGEIVLRRGSGPFWRGAKITASGNRIVSTFGIQSLSLPDANNSIDLQINGHSASTNSLCVSGDGSRIVTLDFDGKWMLWEPPAIPDDAK